MAVSAGAVRGAWRGASTSAWAERAVLRDGGVADRPDGGWLGLAGSASAGGLAGAVCVCGGADAGGEPCRVDVCGHGARAAGADCGGVRGGDGGGVRGAADPGWCLCAAALGPMVRYEDFALVAAIVLVLFGQGRRGAAMRLAGASVVGPVGFSLFLLSRGLPALPTRCW